MPRWVQVLFSLAVAWFMGSCRGAMTSPSTVFTCVSSSQCEAPNVCIDQQCVCPTCASACLEGTCACEAGFIRQRGLCVRCPLGLDARCPLSSCRALPPEAPSGRYFVQRPGANDAGLVRLHCDQAFDGGWTLLARTTEFFFCPALDGGDTTRPWVDVLSVDFVGRHDITTTFDATDVDDGGAPFFALTRTLADLPFGEVRFDDGLRNALQSTAAPLTLRALRDDAGQAPLFTDGGNSGVMLLMGGATQTGPVPCFYPALNAATCELPAGNDTGAENVVFFVGDADQCLPQSTGLLATALWGSYDCYGVDLGGGSAGFIYRRIANPPSIRCYASQGYRGAGWSMWLR